MLRRLARALSKSDKLAIQLLYNLDKKLQAIRDPDNVTLKKLKGRVLGDQAMRYVGSV
ncbi:MAG: hypothetical protein IPM58_10125 [Nitrospira sp.]|nr:hypothetical protein [Nitrospira sp.]